MTDDAFLRGIAETPDDAALRLVYADWLEDHGHAARSEVVRVCERMRCVPVFSDEYWLLKARRNELRPSCPAEWLAATGYDGSRYDALFRDGWPEDWRGRWRLIREFCECWHFIPTGDVRRRAEEVRAEEARVGFPFPPGLREYVAYAHDAGTGYDNGRIAHRDPYTMWHLPGVNALSIMAIGEGGIHWAVRGEDMAQDDPLITTFGCDMDETAFERLDDQGYPQERLTDFVRGFVMNYAPHGGRLGAMVPVAEAAALEAALDAALPVRFLRHGQQAWEGEGILVRLGPSPHRASHDLWVETRRGLPWQKVPDFLWPYARENTFMRGGLFLDEESRAGVVRDFGGVRPPGLEDAPPPLRGLPPRRPPAPPADHSQGDIPF